MFQLCRLNTSKFRVDWSVRILETIILWYIILLYTHKLYWNICKINFKMPNISVSCSLGDRNEGDANEFCLGQTGKTVCGSEWRIQMEVGSLFPPSWIFMSSSYSSIFRTSQPLSGLHPGLPHFEDLLKWLLKSSIFSIYLHLPTSSFRSVSIMTIKRQLFFFAVRSPLFADKSFQYLAGRLLKMLEKVIWVIPVKGIWSVLIMYRCWKFWHVLGCYVTC